MTTRVLGLLGSPRRKGNNEILLDQALAGAQSQGAQVEKVVLNELDLTPCQSCDECLSTGECAIHDDMEQLYPKLRLADHIILASPVFFLGLTAQTKILIDRCQCLWAERKMLHYPANLGQRRGLLISTASRHGSQQFQALLPTTRSFFATLGLSYWGELLLSDLEERGEVLSRPEALRQAFEAGVKLVRGEKVSLNPSPISLRPIGWVRNRYRESPNDGWEGKNSKLVIEPELEPALEGLEGFSHLIVLFWMQLANYEGELKVHPRGRKGVPLIGLLASRSPHRPNPIGVTIVKLLERRGRVLWVKGLDAFDGTPIIDIKPYLPSDEVHQAKRPEWAANVGKDGTG